MTSRKKRLAGIGIAAVVLCIIIDLGAWAVHVQWRDASMEELTPVVDQIDILATQLAEDADWFERNGRLTQQYSEHEQFTARLEAQGRRRTTHDALVDAYNEQVLRLYARFYLAPLPAPAPPLRERVNP
jgi:hypothetical protein